MGKLGHHLRLLRSNGISVPFTNAFLATLAIDQGMELWTFDRHFHLMATVLPLKLFDPPRKPD